MARRYDIRRVKIHRSYTIAEIAKLLSAHKNTVARWISGGLEPIERKRPLLIHGSTLRVFLDAQKPPKQSCGPREIYCVKCRAPKRPAFDEVEHPPRTATTGRLRGICPTCTSMIYRAVKHANVDEICRGLVVTLVDAQSHLTDSPSPILNGDSKDETQ